MTAITLYELSTSDEIMGIKSGTPIRRVFCFIRGVSSNNDMTLNLASYISGAGSIEGLIYNVANNTAAVTALTWSTTTLTFNSGEMDLPVLVGCIVRLN